MFIMQYGRIESNHAEEFYVGNREVPTTSVVLL